MKVDCLELAKRGFHFPDLTIQELYDVVDGYKDRPSLNLVVRVMVELGLPVFRRLQSRNPGLAKELLKKNYSYKVRRRASEKVQLIARDLADGMRIDDRLYVGIPRVHKVAFEHEKRKRGRSMSAIARERMGIEL